MDPLIRTALWNQFGAAIDTLENAIRACPDSLWADGRRAEFWYLVHHTLFFLDYYLADSPEGYRPPPPFTLSELESGGVLPERVYTRDELLAWLAHGREKCRTSIAGLDPERARARSPFRPSPETRLELLLYNLRHVQHHAAQLHLLLRQTIHDAPRWVGRARTPLGAE